MATCTLHAQSQSASTLCCRMDAAKAAQFSMRGATPQEEQALLKHAQALVEEPEEEQGSAAHAGQKHAQQGPVSKGAKGAGKAAGKGKGTKQQGVGQRRTAKKQAPPAFANGATLPDLQGFRLSLVQAGGGSPLPTKRQWRPASLMQACCTCRSALSGLLNPNKDEIIHPRNHAARAQQQIPGSL